MRAAIYARVSSQNQRDRHTIDSQLRELPKFAKDRGWTVVERYVDDGCTAKSGHLGQRDGLKRLFDDARAGRFDVVLVVDIDRLTRSEDLGERGDVLAVFQRAAVKLAVSSTGQILDLGSPTGDLLALLGAYFAADENRKRRERTVRGKQEAIARGRKPSGATPYGLTYDKEAARRDGASGAGWGIDSTKAAVIIEVYRRAAAGASCLEISEDLHVRGARRPRHGAWTRERVWELLRSPTYRGEWLADKARNLHVRVPQIIPDELWFAAQEALDRWNRRGGNRTNHVYLCQGIARCGVCGGNITISSSPSYRAGVRIRTFYYVCMRRLRRPLPGGRRCTLPFLPVATVDLRLWEAIQKELGRPDLLREALASRTADANSESSELAGDLRRFETQKAQLVKRSAKVVADYCAGLINEEVYAQHLAGHQQKLAFLTRQVDSARRQSAFASSESSHLARIQTTLDDLRKRLAGTSPEERRSLVLALIDGKRENVITMAARDQITARILLSSAPSEHLHRVGSG